MQGNIANKRRSAVRAAVWVALSAFSPTLDQFAATVAGCGDLNDDGIGDILVGDSQESTVWVVSGKDGSLIRRLRMEAAGLLFGARVSSAGDLNGDGVREFLVAERSRRLDQFVGVCVVNGKTGEVLRRIEAEQVGGTSPVSVDGSCDLNGDGFTDVLIAWRYYDKNAMDVGCVEVHSGKSDEVLLRLWGEEEHERFGHSACFAGDVDRDGVSDLLVGSLGGFAKVYAGSTGKEIYCFREEALKAFGVRVASMGDLDQDGCADLGVRAEDIVGKSLVIVYSGGTGKVLFELSGPASDGFGASFTGIADLNGDGFRDVLVGADDGFVKPGKVIIYSGKDRSVLRTVEGTLRNSFNSHFGVCLDVIGDVDADGIPDFVVGNNRSWTGSLQGSVHVISGGTGMEIYWLSAVSFASGR